MSKVFVNIGLSLDGYMAPDGMTMENPTYKNWGTKWSPSEATVEAGMQSIVAPLPVRGQA